jgi:hypothetical protein
VDAFARAARAMGYYDAEHPVFLAALDEAHHALEAAARGGASTVAAAGDVLLVDAEGPALDGPAARGLADSFFRAGILAVRVQAGVERSAVLALLRRLGDASPELAPARGGLEPVVVDYGRLFAGERLGLAPEVAQDPVVTRALRRVLHQGRAGEAVEVRLADVATAEDLGDFIEGLLEDPQQDPAPVAEAAAEAIARHRAHVGPDGLAAAAQALSRALVRLPPDGRFELLKRVAERDPEAASRLGTGIDDAVLAETLAAALKRGAPDARAAAVGGLLARLRPLEADRKQLLRDLDGRARAAGRSLDGLLWQTLEARALEDDQRGLLELTRPDVEPGLRAAAQARFRFEGLWLEGQDVLHTLDDRATARAVPEILSSLLAEEGRLEPDLVERLRLELERLETEGDAEGAAELLLGLARRAASDEEAEAALLAWARPPARAHRRRFLLSLGELGPRARGRLALAAVSDGPEGEAEGKRALAGLDVAELRRLLGALGPEARPRALRALLDAAASRDPKAALRLMRAALLERPPPDKEVVLGRLAALADPAAVTLLAHVAGWKGATASAKLAGLSEGADAEALRKRAIAELGQTGSASAARVLLELFERTRWLDGRSGEELRLAAGRALARHPSPEARSALEARAKKGRRALRQLAQRVLSEGADG